MLGYAIEASNVGGVSVMTSEFIITVASAEGAFELNCTRVFVGDWVSLSNPDVALTASVVNSEKSKYRMRLTPYNNKTMEFFYIYIYIRRYGNTHLIVNPGLSRPMVDRF